MEEAEGEVVEVAEGVGEEEEAVVAEVRNGCIRKTINDTVAYSCCLQAPDKTQIPCDFSTCFSV